MFAMVFATTNGASVPDIIACQFGVDKKKEGNKKAATGIVVGTNVPVPQMMKCSVDRNGWFLMCGANHVFSSQAINFLRMK